MPTFPAKINYAAGNVLTAAQMVDIGNGLNDLLPDAKGSLTTVSAANTPAQLTVGNNGETLVADSSTTTGLRWQGSMAAGKNAIINGAFDIWQRGTSSTSSSAYGADRWYQFIGAGSGTWARESTVIPSGARYSMKFTASANGTAHSFTQYMETSTISPLIGKTVVVSAQVAASTSTQIYINLDSSTTADAGVGATWTNITPSSGGSATPTSTTFVTLTGVFVVPSNAASLRLVFGTNSTMANGVSIYIGNVQVEVGSTATTFSRAGGTLAGELLACQRYYWRWTAGDAYTPYGMALKTTATAAQWVCQFPVEMRARVTSLEFSTLVLSNAAGNGTITAMTLGWWGKNTARIDITNNSSGVGDTPGLVQSNNSSSAYFAINAEL